MQCTDPCECSDSQCQLSVQACHVLQQSFDLVTLNWSTNGTTQFWGKVLQSFIRLSIHISRVRSIKVEQYRNIFRDHIAKGPGSIYMQLLWNSMLSFQLPKPILAHCISIQPPPPPLLICKVSPVNNESSLIIKYISQKKKKNWKTVSRILICVHKIRNGFRTISNLHTQTARSSSNPIYLSYQRHAGLKVRRSVVVSHQKPD